MAPALTTNAAQPLLPAVQPGLGLPVKVRDASWLNNLLGKWKGFSSVTSEHFLFFLPFCFVLFPSACFPDLPSVLIISLLPSLLS